MDKDLKITLISELTHLSGYLEGLSWSEHIDFEALEIASEKVNKIIELLNHAGG